MELHPVLQKLDFTPEPMTFQRTDKIWVSFCEEHQWTYVSSLQRVADGMLSEHIQLAHPELAVE
jgi:hypothetical protein